MWADKQSDHTIHHLSRRTRGKGETVESVEIYQQEGCSYDEARSKLEALRKANRSIINEDENFEVLPLSSRTIKKLISGNAVNKSMKNGFTKEQHYVVASDIENLFKTSLKVLEHADKNRSPDIEAIHRFAAPIHIRDGVAYITVKQIKGEGNRLYSMECIEIRKLAGMSAQSDSEPSEPRPSGTSFRKDNIAKLKAAVVDKAERPKRACQTPRRSRY